MRRYNCRLQAVLLLCVTVWSAAAPAGAVTAADGSVTIRTAAEFLSFAKNCTLDVWSQDKTVTLADNIDLSESGFTAVPTFGGVFDGAGFTIQACRLPRRDRTRACSAMCSRAALLKT